MTVARGAAIPAERVRVAHVVGEPTTGGAERCALELVQRLDPQRFAAELIVAGRSAEGPLTQSARARGVALRHVPFTSLRSLSGGARLLRALADRDLVHVHSRPLDYQIAALLRARARRRPRLVWTRHLPYGDLSPQALRRYRWSARFTQAVVACSPGVAAHLRDVERLADPKIQAIPNGVDAAAYRPPRSRAERALRRSLGAEGAVVLLCVGRLVAQKGIDRLLRAAAGLAERRDLPPWQLWVAGDGPERPALAEELARRGLGATVRLLGERDDVERLLRAADLFVLLSRREGLPLSVLEALASGLPSVVTDLPAYTGLDLGAALRRVAGHDDAAIASAASDVLARLIASGPERRRLAPHARRRMLTGFRIEDWVRRHEELYARLLPGRKA